MTNTDINRIFGIPQSTIQDHKNLKKKNPNDWRYKVITLLLGMDKEEAEKIMFQNGFNVDDFKDKRFKENRE